MIRITKEADYGIVLLSLFAKSKENSLLTARDLSDSSSLPLPMVSKILKILGKSRILVSHRGVKGGYSLRKKPEDITLSEIIRALEGPIALTTCCMENSDSCDRESICDSRENWGLINQAVINALDEVTLQQMVDSPNQIEKLKLGISMENAKQEKRLGQTECCSSTGANKISV